jgi:hypothetical protein
VKRYAVALLSFSLSIVVLVGCLMLLLLYHEISTGSLKFIACEYLY